MSDKRKKWSVSRFFGDIGGGALTGGAAFGAKSILIPDPSGTFQITGILVGAAGGGVAGAVGSIWGYATDDSFAMQFRSAILFNSVVGIAIAMPLVLLGFAAGGERLTDNYVLLVVIYAAFISAALAYLLDDRRARHERREQEPDYMA